MISVANSPKTVKFKTAVTKSDTGSGWHFLIVEGKVAKKLEFPDKFRRVICTVNKGTPFQCALLPWGDKYYIIFNQQKRSEIGAQEGDVVNVTLEKDESKYGLPMPAELKEVLKQDREGNKLFHALTQGKQRSMLYYIGQVKDIDKRIHACLVLMEHLKENDGKIIGDKLAAEWKRPIWYA